MKDQFKNYNPLISIVCPVYNEENYIDGLLSFLVHVDPVEKEIFFIDGGSTDKTVEKIKHFAEKHKGIFLIHNPDKFVPYALNLAIPKCTGDSIVRLDAHCKYNQDYFLKIQEVFERTGADIVGGPTRTAFHTITQQAIGYAISTPFGVGNSRVHQVDFEGETDSVTFGAWRRDLFKDTGLFDTLLKRNQDDEFHYRAKSLGKRIYQSPEIKLYYYPRSSLSSLFSQYFQYGYYKPLVLKKVKSEIKIRHLAPSFFVIYVLASPFLWWVHPATEMPLLFYVLALLFFAVGNKLSFHGKLICLAVYPVIHFAYGLGFIKGLIYPPKK